MGTAEGLGGKGVLWVIVCTLELGGQSGGPGPQCWTSTQHWALLSDLQSSLHWPWGPCADPCQPPQPAVPRCLEPLG